MPLRAILAASLLLWLAPLGAGAVTLADLAAGGTLATGHGVVLHDFEVQVRGRGLPDADQLELVPTATGFALVGPVGATVRGNVRLRYTASTSGEIVAAALSVSVEPERGLRVGVSESLREGRRRIGRLRAQARAGRSDAQASFGPLASLSIDQRISLRGAVFPAGGSPAGAPFVQSFAATGAILSTPEPATALLLGLGLLGLARRARLR